jgi:hypothetical protein
VGKRKSTRKSEVFVITEKEFMRTAKHDAENPPSFFVCLFLVLQDAADATKSAARSTVDATTRVAKQAEEKIAAGGSAVLAGASKAEEKTGAVLKDAGDKLEKDGRQSKQFYRGEEVKHEGKKKWFGLF